MITRSGPDRWRLGAAAAACALAALLFVAALVRALSLDETVPIGLPDDAGSRVAVDAAANEPLSSEALLLAVEQDPFAPDRQRSAGRYRLPGDVDPEPPPLPQPPPPPPPFALFGTVVDVADASGSALIQLGDEPPRLIPVGASLGGYRLTRVAPEAAVMSNGERDLLLQVPGPQRQVAAAPAETPQRGNARGSNARQAPENARQLLEAAREQQLRQLQMVEALERARQSGAPPEVLETLERAIQQGGNAPIYNIRRRPVPDTTQSSTPRAPDLR